LEDLHDLAVIAERKSEKPIPLEEMNGVLECGDLSPLWSVATCRGYGGMKRLKDQGVKPPKAKAVTGYRTPN
jgi:hypothetical protein